MKNRLTAIGGGRVGGREIEQNRKKERTHGHGQQCSDFRRKGDEWGEREYGG